jgi:hypothetical protein
MISIKFRVGAKRLDRARLGFDLCPGLYYHKAFEIINPFSFSSIMTLIRLIQRASILAGITFASFSVYGSPAHADTQEFCVTSNGKTTCGTLKTLESGCVTTGSGATACGKFKFVKKAQAQEREQEDRTPVQNSSYRKEVNGVTYLLRGCKMSDRPGQGDGSHVKCNFVLTVKRDNQAGYVYAGGGNSSITDVSGNTYPSIYIGYNGNTSYSEYNIKMSTGIDYVVDLYFPMKQEITKLSLLNVVIANRKILQFRNISVSN